MDSSSVHNSSPRWLAGAVAGFALIIAIVSARDYAGSWNDGSRLATVEALVDHQTMTIDNSVFVRVPAVLEDSPSPYPKDDALLMKNGTADKLFIDGHFYSDKSPVPALLMAGAYQVWQWITGITAADNVDEFCFGMTLLTAGLSYVVAVWCIFRIGQLAGFSAVVNLGFTASFAMATVALPYVRHVNNHIMLLGVVAAIMLNLFRLASAGGEGGVSKWSILGLGSLAGLGYSIDLGAGPVLMLCLLPVVVFRCRSVSLVALFLLGALPWIALHHGVNYWVGGTWKPANAVAEYFLWPGCPFNPENMTGGWNHKSIGHGVLYSLALLFGKNGFLGHNLVLFLALPAIVLLLRKNNPHLPEVLFAGFWCGGTWLAYGLTSNNYSGQCCSIRWFVPLLAPAYFAVAIYLRRFPAAWKEFWILSVWGAVMAGLAWWHGPWMKHMVPFYWPIQGACLATWIGYRLRQRNLDKLRSSGMKLPAEERAKAA